MCLQACIGQLLITIVRLRLLQRRGEGSKQKAGDSNSGE
jgi:hypothetical protein